MRKETDDRRRYESAGYALGVIVKASFYIAVTLAAIKYLLG